MSGYRGLAVKRAEKVTVEAVEQTPSTPQEDGTGTGGDDDPTGTENEPETGDQGSSDDDAGDDSPDDAAGDESEPADEGYDPSAHTVSEVQAYLEDNPDQATYVLDRERADKARKTLIGA
uniref:Head-to-tail connector protein n=2 Tax=unclassified bacterial viruses TaxID=12333 RepID=A0AAU7J7X2_9VIRU